MKVLISLVRAYPVQAVLTVGSLMIAGLLEGIGLTMLLPLLSLAVAQQGGTDVLPAASMGGKISTLDHAVTSAFNAFGLVPGIGAMLSIMMGCIVLKSFIMLLAKRQVGYTVAKVATDLRLSLLRSLLSARWEHYLSQPAGALANAMVMDANQSSKAYLAGTMMAAETLKAAIYTAAAFLISWRVTLFSLAASGIIMLILRRYVRRSRTAGKRQSRLFKSLTALMVETLLSIKPLKAMARENQADFMLNKNTQDLNKNQQKQVINKELMKALQEPLIMVFMAAGIYVLLVLWRMPLTQAMILLFLVSNVLKELNKVQERYQEIVTCENHYWSIQKTIRDVKENRETSYGHKIPSFDKEIRLENVSFAYADKLVLRNVSMHIPQGQITVLIGPSGAGKTTIIDLVTGLLTPQRGAVLIDQVPLNQVDLRAWRRMCGYVPQEIILLHDTIANNVSLGDQGVSEKDITTALGLAGVWEHVQSLPEKIHHVVGERGGKLSGGQRQRIAIARALVHKPKLLILDEATTALDPQNEAAICKTLSGLRGEFTILAISHQPVLMKIADHVYRIQNGELLLGDSNLEKKLISIMDEGKVHTSKRQTMA